jgi:competence protein ComEC
MPSLAKKLGNLFLPYRIFTVLALFFLTGTLIASFVNVNFTVSWPIFVLTILVLLFFAFISVLFRENVFILVSFALIFLYLGLGYYSFFDTRAKTVYDYGQEITIEGKIAKRPDADYKSQKFVLEFKNSETGKKNYILIKTAHFPEHRFGDQLNVRGVVKKPENFSDFDYAGYLKRSLVFGIIENPSITYLGESRNIGDMFMSSLYYVSSSFEDSINKIMPEPQASLAAGILLGVKRNIPDSIMENLNKAGLTHIIALSGFNVTIIVAIISSLLVGVVGRRKTFYLGSALVIIFVLMTGASASIVRAAIFSLLVLFGMTLGRRADKTNLLLLAGVIMVAFNPYVIRYDIGFQLSFLAFAGLIYFSPLINLLFVKMKTKNISESVKLIFAETFGAQIAVSPLIWLYFGRFSLIAPVANLLVLPVVPLSMGLIFLTGILGIIYYPLGQIGSLILWPILEYIIKEAEILAKLPLSSISK